MHSTKDHKSREVDQDPHPQTSPQQPNPCCTEALLPKLLDFLCDVCHLVQNVALFDVDCMCHEALLGQRERLVVNKRQVGLPLPVADRDFQRGGCLLVCMRARLSPIELVRPTAFSLAMRSFQQTVGIYQIAERLLTFLVRILILQKAATSGVSSSGTILTTQEFLVPIRHFAASIMVGASPYVNGFCGVMAAYGCAWHDCTQRGGSIPRLGPAAPQSHSASSSDCGHPSSFSACNLQNFFKMNSHHHTFGIPTDRRCLQR